MSWVFAFLASCTLTRLLAACWRRRGWGDGPGGQASARKLQASAVPPVGGLAILLAWAAQAAFTAGAGGEWLDLGWQWPGSPATASRSLMAASASSALASALLVGWVDDARAAGLAPLAKASGQLFAGALLSLPLWLCSDETGVALALWWTAIYASAGFVACNALNTFDNADGAAAGVGAAGLLAASSWLAPALLGFLVIQLWGRRKEPSSDPIAYLGDAGSHLLGMTALVVPGAWPLLWLPLLDLLRVSVLRLSLGIPPWQGDRRHLAHRMQGRGLGRVACVAWLLVIASPALLAAPAWRGAGLLATAGLFGAAVWLTRPRAEPISPKSAPSIPKATDLPHSPPRAR